MGRRKSSSGILAKLPLRLPGHGGFFQAAYARISGDGQTDPGELGAISPEDERLVLERWAVETKRLIDPVFFDGLHFIEGKSEHEVFCHPENPGWIFKRWNDKPYFAGDYLMRWILSNALFGDEADLEGVTFHKGSQRRVPVVRQPFRIGTIPEEHAVDETMRALGFLPTGRSGVWVNLKLGVDVADVEPHNFIQETSTGKVFPIDVRPSFLDSRECR